MLLSWRYARHFCKVLSCAQAFIGFKNTSLIHPKQMATHSSIPAWRIPWTEEPGRLLSVESQESDTTWRLNYYYYYYLIHPPTGRDVCTLTGKSVATHSVCCKSRYIADNCFSIVLYQFFAPSQNWDQNPSRTHFPFCCYHSPYSNPLGIDLHPTHNLCLTLTPQVLGLIWQSVLPFQKPLVGLWGGVFLTQVFPFFTKSYVLCAQ